MEKIFSHIDSNKLLHIVLTKKDFSSRTEVISEENFLQLATISIKKNQKFRAHRHLMKKVNFDEFWAQESWVVLSGKIEVTFFDVNDMELCKKILNKGDVSITLSGGHSYRAIKKSKVYEFKSGPYFGQAADKIFLDEILDKL